MFFSERKIVGVDFNDYYAEVVEILCKKDTPVLEAYGRTVIPSEVITGGAIVHVEDLREIIKDLFRDASPKPISTKDVAVILPSNKILTHVFTFPAALTNEEVAGALPYEIEKVIPFPIEDIYYDFVILEVDTVGKYHASQNVLFSCIEKSIADGYLSLFRSLKITPHLFGVVPEALKYALRVQLSGEEVVMVVEVDTLSTNYMLVDKGVIKYFYSSNSGGRKLVQELAEISGMTDDDIIRDKAEGRFQEPGQLEVIQGFFAKIYKRATDIIKDQSSKGVVGKVDRVLLTGKFLDISEAHVLAKKSFKAYKVGIGDPKNGLSMALGRTESFQDQSSATAPYSIFFVHSLGAAFRALCPDGMGRVNLLPSTLKKMFLDKKKSMRIAMASVVMTAISVVVAGFLFFEYQSLTFSRVGLEIKKSAVEKLLYGVRYQEIREEIMAFNKEVDALSNIDKKLFSVPALLEDLYNLIPEDIELTSLAYNDRDLLVDVHGIAQTREKLLELQRKFETAEFIDSVVAPISNYDEKQEISFLFQLKLDFTKLKKYARSARK